MKPVTVQHAVEVLNEALEADPDALRRIINHRVRCSDKLAEHPTIQVGPSSDASPHLDQVVGALGLLNGIFGISEDGDGFIHAIMDAAGNIRGFAVKASRPPSVRPWR